MKYHLLSAALLSLALASCSTVPSVSEAGFTSLFDGQSLNHWKFVGKPGEGYKVRNGAIVCEQGVKGNLFTEKEFENFILRFDFLVDAGSNNGIGIRAPLEGDSAYVGMEVQVLEETGALGGKWGKLRPEQYHGSIYDLFGARTGAMKKPGLWNTQEIVANGRSIKVTLNGQVICEADLNSVTDPEKLAKHPGILRERGHIGFLGHNDHVEFRNIRIKELASSFRENIAPFPGFKAVYNGHDLSNWKGLMKSPYDNPIKRAALSPADHARFQAEADQRMRDHWKSVHGALQFDGKGDSLCTVQDYGDFEMFVDFKITERGDSGIYLRGTPQVQIWDPFTAPQQHGSEVGSGGLYNNQKNPSKPTRMADRPIGEWNRFHILMQGEKVTLFLNGELVTHNVVLENYWDRNQPLMPTGQIELQNHGNNLWFKNVHIRELGRK